MKTLPFVEPADVKAALGATAAVVARGGVVVIPTESYYGLAADPARVDAVSAVLDLKGRSADLGLPVVCADWRQVEKLVTIPERHRVRLSRIWPAALSVIVPIRTSAPAALGETLAVRIPDHDHLRALLYRSGPLTATSANGHGQPPSTRVEAALASLHGEPELVLDAGELPGGRVSTMVDLSIDEGLVVRPGAVAWEQALDLGQWVVQKC